MTKKRLKPRSKVVLHSKTIAKRWNVDLPKPDGNYYRFTFRNPETNKDMHACAFYINHLQGCCGAILASSFAFSYKREWAENQIQVTTEYLQNYMNKHQTPLCLATITTAAMYHADFFKKFGWKVGEGVRSVKHRFTDGANGTVENYIYPLALLARKEERLKKVYAPDEIPYVEAPYQEEDDYYDEAPEEDFDPDFDEFDQAA